MAVTSRGLPFPLGYGAAPAQCCPADGANAAKTRLGHCLVPSGLTVLQVTPPLQWKAGDFQASLLFPTWPEAPCLRLGCRKAALGFLLGAAVLHAAAGAGDWGHQVLQAMVGLLTLAMPHQNGRGPQPGGTCVVTAKPSCCHPFPS